MRPEYILDQTLDAIKLPDAGDIGELVDLLLVDVIDYCVKCGSYALTQVGEVGTIEIYRCDDCETEQV